MTKKKNRSWDHLKEAPKQPQGPQKPWDPEMETAAEEFVDFLKDSNHKKLLQDFIVDTYKQYEEERIAKFQSKIEHEKQVDERKILPHHDAGNITSMVSDALNMHNAEMSFARGIKSTKRNLERTLEDRVEEINNLLAGIGGFNAQLRSCFARSTVVFLEQEDPNYDYRERLIFSINLPNYELTHSWEEKGNPQDNLEGRTELQATWDQSVNALAEIIDTTGLKPKYVKNDRNYGRLVMKQDLRSSNSLPDEYFSFTLDYNTQEKIQEMIGPYNQIVREYDTKLAKLEKKIKSYPAHSESSRFLSLKKKHLELKQERDFFVGTTPDPNQLEEGLLFLIEVSTLKDYHIVKDRMQSIMTKYILHLSKIAVKEAQTHPELEHELYKLADKQIQKERASERDPIQWMEEVHGRKDERSEDLQEYEVDATDLKPIRRKAG